jgi:hypothetical protein
MVRRLTRATRPRAHARAHHHAVPKLQLLPLTTPRALAALPSALAPRPSRRLPRRRLRWRILLRRRLRLGQGLGRGDQVRRAASGAVRGLPQPHRHLLARRLQRLPAHGAARVCAPPTTTTAAPPPPHHRRPLAALSPPSRLPPAALSPPSSRLPPAEIPRATSRSQALVRQGDAPLRLSYWAGGCGRLRTSTLPLDETRLSCAGGCRVARQRLPAMAPRNRASCTTPRADSSRAGRPSRWRTRPRRNTHATRAPVHAPSRPHPPAHPRHPPTSHPHTLSSAPHPHTPTLLRAGARLARRAAARNGRLVDGRVGLARRGARALPAAGDAPPRPGRATRSPPIRRR